MSQDRLINLAMKSIENDVCETLNICEIISKFSTVKAIKNKM